MNLNRQDGMLQTLLDRAVQATQTAGKKPMRIIRDPEGEQVRLHTDLDRLTQVFINLVSNAQKYCTAEDPELRIEVHSGDNTTIIDFIDNGAGIPEQDRHLIFEKFSRLGYSDGTGAGLGLAICSEIMERLGGSIAYLPDTGGTGFRVTLPQAQAMAAQ